MSESGIRAGIRIGVRSGDVPTNGSHARISGLRQGTPLTRNRRYHSRRYTQIRLRRLWDLGYLERSGLPPPTCIGGSPHVYRLAPAAIARLGYAPRPWRGPGYIAHTLDAVEAVCALVRSTDPDTQPAVTRWLPESIVVDVLPAARPPTPSS